MRIDKTYRKEGKAKIKTLQKNEGFTLLEVVIALSIFSVGLLAVAAMQTSAVRMNSTAGQITDLTNWAQDKMETLMALPFSDPWLESAGNPPGSDSAGNTHQETTTDGYTVSWNITDDNPIPNTKQIVISVTGEGKTGQLTSMRAEW